MATFTGTTGNDVANATTGAITGFTGGTVTELQDATGDNFVANTGLDTIVAGSGADTINAGGGNDSVDGGTGNDNFIGGGGADVIIGGSGIDDVRYDRDQSAGGANGVIVNLSGTTYTGGAVNVAAHQARDGFLAFDSITGVELIRGTAFVDHLIGGDSLNGSSANDGFEGFRGLAGADVIKGGTGYDEVRYDFDASN